MRPGFYYVVYRNHDGTEWGLVPSDSPQRERLSRDTYGRFMERVAEFRERSWKRAKEAYEAIMFSHEQFA